MIVLRRDMLFLLLGLTATTTRVTSSSLECGVFLAPSSIPGAGLGMFAGQSFVFGEQVTYGDIVIPLTEVNWHNYHHHKQQQEQHQLLDQTSSIHNTNDTSASTGNNNNGFFWLWDEYVWGHSIAPEMETEIASEDIHAASPGIGAALNCFYPRLNLQDFTHPRYDFEGLHRSKDPGSGAFTPYHGRATMATRDIAAGDELFMDYGEDYFETRSALYGEMPFLQHFDEADNLLAKFHDLMERTSARKRAMKMTRGRFISSTGIHAIGNGNNYTTHAIPHNAAAAADTDDTDSTDLWQDLYGIMKSWDSRTTNALPSEMPDRIDETLENGGTIHQFDERSRKPVDWLHQEGTCMDHLQSAPSTIPQAGRGAFATRFLPKGTIVAPAPLIHIPNRTVLNMYDETLDENGFITPNVESKPVHSQLLLNYCLGHPESSVLLSPYGALVNLINHSSKRPNVRMQWSTKLTRHREWMDRDPMEMTQQSHAGLVMDFVALRDIEEGEEIFLDYGPAWEAAWEDYTRTWTPPPEAESYRSALEMNQDVDSTLRTFYEGKPLASHLTLWLHGDYRNFQYQDSTEYAFLRATVLDRYHYTTKEGKQQVLYMVQTFLAQDTEEWTELFPDTILWGIPRDAFIFDDAAYTRDHQQRWSFRHEIHIPDDIFPPAWKNL